MPCPAVRRWRAHRFSRQSAAPQYSGGPPTDNGSRSVGQLWRDHLRAGRHPAQLRARHPRLRDRADVRHPAARDALEDGGRLSGGPRGTPVQPRHADAAGGPGNPTGLQPRAEHRRRRRGGAGLPSAGPYIALERWRAGTTEPLRHTFSTAQILSDVGRRRPRTGPDRHMDRRARPRGDTPAAHGVP